MKTQNDTILEHLKQHGEITALTAFSRYQITRLAARIHELRQDGYSIESVRSEDDNFNVYTVRND